MSNEEIYLGTYSPKNGDWIRGECLYLKKHSWDCGRYWGMGYIGNKNLHTRFDETFFMPTYWTNVDEHFKETYLTQDDWWKLLEYMKTAYALRQAAEVIGRGGSHITDPCIEPNKKMAAEINERLGKLLDEIWDWLKKTEKNQRTPQC